MRLAEEMAATYTLTYDQYMWLKHNRISNYITPREAEIGEKHLPIKEIDKACNRQIFSVVCTVSKDKDKQDHSHSKSF